MTSVNLRRLAIAFACSIAIHEVLIALIPPGRPPEPAAREILTHVTIARVERHPTPRPTPTPTPPPKIVVRAFEASGTHAHVARIKHEGAKRPTPPKSIEATPLPIVVPSGGTGAGAQNGSGAGSLSQTQGSGNGTGAQGSGNGAGICGAADYSSAGEHATFDPATGTYERSNILVTVHYADGHAETIPLDWAWHWKSEADDPFDINSDAPLLFQFPPLAQRAQEPPLVQFIMAHTAPTGRSLLNTHCPNIPQAPTMSGSEQSAPTSVPSPPGG